MRRLVVNVLKQIDSKQLVNLSRFCSNISAITFPKIKVRKNKQLNLFFIHCLSWKYAPSLWPTIYNWWKYVPFLWCTIEGFMSELLKQCGNATLEPVCLGFNYHCCLIFWLAGSKLSMGFFFFPFIAGLLWSINAIWLFNESWAWVEPDLNLPQRHQVLVQPVLGVFGGDLKNATTVGIEPMTYRLLGLHHIHYTTAIYMI